MEQRIINIYEYNELDEKAKEKARQWYIETLDDFWQECALEDIDTALRCFGINAEVRYRGFWSQGDGASFNGIIRAHHDALPLVKKEFPSDAELITLAKELDALRRGENINAKIVQSGFYLHENTMFLEECEPEEKEEELLNLLRYLARWAYSYLKAAYKWETSGENIAEVCAANEWRFTKSGEFFRG